MVDLLQEQKVSFAQLAREAGVSIPTVWRWAQRGIRGVKLESYAEGGRRYTTREARGRFVEKCTAVATGAVPPSTSPQTARQRSAAIAKAERELDKAGVK